jgi:hypothetical protein
MQVGCKKDGPSHPQYEERNRNIEQEMQKQKIALISNQNNNVAGGHCEPSLGQ